MASSYEAERLVAELIDVFRPLHERDTDNVHVRRYGRQGGQVIWSQRLRAVPSRQRCSRRRRAIAALAGSARLESGKLMPFSGPSFEPSGLARVMRTTIT